MIAATILLVAFELVTTTSVCAQSVADLDHTMRAMKLRMTALNTARKNLEQIEIRAADHEQSAVRNITDADVAVFSSAVKVFTVAFIASGMQCPDDIAFTQKQFGLIAKSLVKTADEELTQLNANLTNIAAPAALLEATNIRDAVVDLRDILKPFAAEE
jgi:hypothetical protein